MDRPVQTVRRRARGAIATVREFHRGYRYARTLPPPAVDHPAPRAPGELERYFDAVTEGPGVWKWRHYFGVYDRHLSTFRGRSPVVVEIGIYSGGSLPMWREYFGPGCQIHGIDIEPACTSYADDGIDIHIGDQADPEFWRGFIEKVGRVDVVIDDGGHEAHQQIATLEALLPAITPGGVFICEDVHGPFHPFHSYVDGLTRSLSAIGADATPPTTAHEQVASVHRYPLLTVIEKPAGRVPVFDAPRHGTEWQPFPHLAAKS
jgi:hypothetical protein